MHPHEHNPLGLPPQLPLARYRFDILLEDPLILPEYAGSTLRGVFGHALRRAACMTRQPECHGCMLHDSCPYPRLFAAHGGNGLNRSQQHTPPQAYIIEAPDDGRRHYRPGEHYRFEMVLTGHARHQLPLIAHSFKQAFARGITAARSRGGLAQIAVETPAGWQGIFSGSHIQPHPDTLTLPQHYPDSATLHIRTPLRLQHQGSVLGIHRVRADILLRQLMRRVSSIATLYWQHPIRADFGRLAQAARQVDSRPQLQWHDWTRYSNRQQQAMTLGGLTGHWHLAQLPPAFAQLLYLGQWLHIGKETTFGLGRYHLQNS
ncbi:hypothetical protein L1281_002482 [Neisseria sp. HSC-16F19]|nr:CRISPR system precrRNA processing endoribonuclease RAMP protein Cas6 [Neisseria sp. HSC-16F19]MCP2041864.1 hypothetical protein [Neisseria sp. HSC-16F19]